MTPSVRRLVALTNFLYSTVHAALVKDLVSIEIGGTYADSYSQVGQDVQVARHFSGKHNGYFVEVGAYNGVEFSNSYMLEKYFNWTGVLVEPLPSAFATLLHARKPSTRAFNVAADSVAGRQLSFVSSEMYSGDASRLNHPDVLLSAGTDRLSVTTRTLTDMLDEAGAPPFIDFLSVDTEGAELDVLQGLDWSRYSFGYMCIETNGREPARTLIREFLRSVGYTFHRQNLWDDDYIPLPIQGEGGP